MSPEYEFTHDLIFVDQYGQRISIGVYVDIDDEDMKVIAISSDDRLVEIVDGCRMRVGSGHGCGGTTISAQWVIRVIRALPAGTYAFISSLPDAINSERLRREQNGLAFKRWLVNVRGAGKWLVDDEFDSNAYMRDALIMGVDMYVRQYR